MSRQQNLKMESTQYRGFAYQLTDLDKSKEQPNKLANSEISCIKLNNNLLKISSPPPLFYIKKLREEGRTFGLLLPTTKHLNF